MLLRSNVLDARQHLVRGNQESNLNCVEMPSASARGKKAQVTSSSVAAAMRCTESMLWLAVTVPSPLSISVRGLRGRGAAESGLVWCAGARRRRAAERKR